MEIDGGTAPVRVTAIEPQAVLEGPEQGRTEQVPDGVAVQLAVGAESARFQRDLLSVLNGGGPLGAVEADPDLVIYFEGLETIGEMTNTAIERWLAENGDAVRSRWRGNSWPCSGRRSGLTTP